MLQRLLEDWNDLVILVLVVCLTLVFFGILNYPNESWKEKVDAVKTGRYGTFLKIALSLIAVLLVVKIVISING
jgi:hypothetical protein